jgi:hypothetical protein
MLLKVSALVIVKLVALCAALCVVVPVLGARHLPPHNAWYQFGFDACDLPCYAAITPGRSGFGSSSSSLILQVPAIDRRMISTGTSLSFWARLPAEELSGIIRYAPGGGVSEIRLNARLPVERMIDQLGAPDCILGRTSESPAQMTVIFWERGVVSVGAVLRAGEKSVNLKSDVLAIWLRAVNPSDCSLRGAVAWRGFAPLWSYGYHQP